MSSKDMSVEKQMHEELKAEQRQALSTMNTRQKLGYFWYYYKVHVIVAAMVIALAVMFVYQFATNKDYGFYAALVNAQLTEANYETADEWAASFQEYAGIDPGEYLVGFDTSISVSDDTSSQYAVSNQEKMLAMLQIGVVHTIVADTETFEKYAQNEYFHDLTAILSEEEIRQYSPYFYYTDAAGFDMGDDDTFHTEAELTDPASLTIDHRNPSTMEKPVAVGIIVTRDNLIADAGYYDYLADNGVTYQGYPSEAVLGIPITYAEPEYALRFLSFIHLQ